MHLNFGDTSGSTDEDDVIDLLTGELGILQDTLDGVDGRLEEGRVDLLETRTSDVSGEVLALTGKDRLVYAEDAVSTAF